MKRTLAASLSGLPVFTIWAFGAVADSPDWTTVSAIFVERCVMCHSAHGASLGLRLDSYEGALAGSEKGPVLVPGDPGGSELLRRLRGESLPRMPFLSYPLPPEQIDVITAWVETGLPESRNVAILPESADVTAPGPIGAGPPLH